MMLIAREEIIMAVIEGNLIFFGGVFVLYFLCAMATEAVKFFSRCGPL